MNVDKLINQIAKEHHRVPEQRCPECDDKITCHAGVTTTDMPEPGDVSVCAVCGAILVFGEGLKVQLCPSEALEQMKAEEPDNYETLMNLQREVKGFQRARQRMNFGRN